MTQTELILDALQKGERLTPLDALERFGCFRLAARVKDLRADGHKIETVNVSRNGKTYAEYSLVQSA